jgi:hypothetical protein
MFNGFTEIQGLERLEFKTQQEYAEWRIDWKNCYNSLSEELKYTKSLFKKRQRELLYKEHIDRWDGRKHWFFEPHIGFSDSYYVLLCHYKMLERLAIRMNTILAKGKHKIISSGSFYASKHKDPQEQL